MNVRLKHRSISQHNLYAFFNIILLPFLLFHLKINGNLSP